VSTNKDCYQLPVLKEIPIPEYVSKPYWWAYEHPVGQAIFDHLPMVNLILWGNYSRLVREVLKDRNYKLLGKTLQVASCYGNLIPGLVDCVEKGGSLDVIDVIPNQLKRLACKLKHDAPVHMHLMDSTHLEFADNSYDQVICFLLPHEQPVEFRRQSLAEALRVLKPGGTFTLVEFGRPKWWHPVWLYLAFLQFLEPFAWDLWTKPLATWLPQGVKLTTVTEKHYFGDWFQLFTWRKE
jgi:ubiquinone/menaquinone biosynthesis C-methylase UbiE